MSSFFTAYFDASYGNGMTVVAGWLGTARAWEIFDLDWKILLAQYDIPYFHMKEFAHSKGPFKHWKGEENKRANFISKAMDIIGHNAHFGSACLVHDAIFYKLDKVYALKEVLGNPYSLAGRDCVAHMNTWILKEERGLEVDYVFEDGDLGKGLLIDAMKLGSLRVPTFAPSRDQQGTPGRLPLQVADFAAYEMLKGARTGEYAPLYTHRKSLKALAAIPGWWGQYEEKDLLGLCQDIPIPPRSDMEKNR